MIKLTESPRDAMQGLKQIISTQDKIEYISLLMKVGFEIIDGGSFVSPKAIPQMADTAEVLRKIDSSGSDTKILIITGNSRYAKEAANHERVDYISYPFSISETFLEKNLRSNFDKALKDIELTANICAQKNKKMIISLSAAFGNPYGELWDTEIVLKMVDKIKHYDLDFIPLADTFSSGTPEIIGNVFNAATKEFSDIDFNIHLHTTKTETLAKINAAYDAGCRNFDTVYSGIGGCPMSGKELVGNLDTNILINWAKEKQIELSLDKEISQRASLEAIRIMGNI